MSDVGYWAASSSLTVRDYFAAAALRGPVQWDYMQASKRGEEMSCDHMALLCYQVADAMLKAREAK